MIKKNKPLDCDILVIGGGTAGMMAAIYGAQAGADVILAEKANTRRSGAGATGNDHFQCYIPEIHGSEQEFMNLFMHDRPGGKGKDMNLNVAFMRGSFDVVQDWERWGIPMRPHGFWEFTGHTLPWIQGTHLKYAGVNQKPAFTKEALRCGVRILNRHPAIDLITNENGAICGAVLVDLTENVPKMLVINCKAVILCTARGGFLNGSERMGCIFNSASCYTNTGDGSAMAWKVGARMLGYGVSGEMSSGGIGASRYFVRGGTRTWVGTYTDLYGHTWAPFGQETNYDVLNPKYPGEAHIITYPDYKTGDYTQYLPENKMKDAYAKGKTVFMSFAFNNQEDTDYMKWALVHEGNGATLSHLDDEGFDFKKHMLEFKSEMSGGAYCGGPDVTERGETTVSGLY
ncbi:MAG: FAD-binding protein, partial [Oscillospiraceae bacterium]|nr:FAD-binding protein [Oscillospiraceae bacterium]